MENTQNGDGGKVLEFVLMPDVSMSMAVVNSLTGLREQYLEGAITSTEYALAVARMSVRCIEALEAEQVEMLAFLEKTMLLPRRSK